MDPSKKGAYSGLGSDRVFAPVERELVFDIVRDRAQRCAPTLPRSRGQGPGAARGRDGRRCQDMTDYDDIRTCCKGGDICHKCWPLMTIAVKVVDTGLREDFGFQHLFWVYSGRRGVHCWVCDARARCMTNEQRAAVADYFSVYKGSDQGKKVSLNTPLHPSLQRAYDLVLRDYWLEARRRCDGRPTGKRRVAQARCLALRWRLTRAARCCCQSRAGWRKSPACLRFCPSSRMRESARL